MYVSFPVPGTSELAAPAEGPAALTRQARRLNSLLGAAWTIPSALALRHVRASAPGACDA